MQSDFIALKKLIIKTTSPGMRRGLLQTRDRMLDYHARWRNLNGWLGSLPNFLIVGTQKGGTTELYDQLSHHPNITPAFVKEVHFFDLNYDKGVDWYSTFFPQRVESQGNYPGEYVTGEASPCYIFHPAVAQRARATVPHAKIIMLLRNPVNRAYSHYHHEVRLGYETLPFEEAIAQEPNRLRGEKEKMLADDTYPGDYYMHYSYQARGQYIEQIERWREYFPASQLLVLPSEAFYGDITGALRTVCEFLEIAPIQPVKLAQHKSFPYPKMDPGMRQYLRQYFAPYNHRLFDYLGQEFAWD